MLSKESFTDAEWAKAIALPGLVMGAAALADGRKLVSTVREVVAGSEAFKATAAKYPDNALVSAFLTNDQSASAAPYADENAPKPRNMAEAVELITAQIGQIIPTIKEKATPEEFAAVRDVLMAAAHAVVERTGSGALGFGGEQVDEGERAFMDELDTLLG